MAFPNMQRCVDRESKDVRYLKRTKGTVLTYIDHHIRFRNALFSGLSLEVTVLQAS